MRHARRSASVVWSPWGSLKVGRGLEGGGVTGCATNEEAEADEGVKFVKIAGHCTYQVS